ncbi:MAG: 50S rRNA methyltransferase [Alkaliphilus sp.]|nr:23S rRNA (pseudouridine(1915)-N(3))-methyltransferase RlmH [bacterium AH-315-G05]MBN4074363.1 23S rRNA (pseudouridine(1915)-N(3))-methyltransferase RlmH [bacterium AH-315-E09]PHS36073.1 MAG: 50S rRNA methyltransferase [Alkaliphilus sp.]
MKINIIVASEKLESFYKDAIQEYNKRLSSYCKIKLFQCKNTKEAEKKIPKNSYVIQICTSSTLISSEFLATKLNSFAVSGVSNIAIIFNFPYSSVDETISISPLKMCDGLLLTIIYEQIYRAFRIINNQAYHK